MVITRTAIKRGVTFMMIYLIAVGFGLFSLGRLKVDLWPKLDFPVIAIISQYTGVGPFDIETSVTRPMEETIASVQNVKTVNSTTRQGLSLILLEFEWGTDMNQAEIDVRNSLDWVEDYLPADVSDPLVFAFDPSMQPIGFYTINSKLHGLAELRRISELELEPRIERIPGVASASTSGGLKREIKVLADPGRMKAHHVAIQQIEAALRMNNLQLPSGYIDDPFREYPIQTQGEYREIADLEETSIARIAGSTVHVKDVANVVDGFVESRQRIFTDGKQAVIMIVQKQSDANTLNVTREFNKRLPKILNELPKGITVSPIFEQSEFIEQSISNLGSSALQAVILTFLVLMFFLRNIRSSLIVAVSIPVSMIVTFAVMDQAGLTLNMISMAGLALAVGMLVDNSIVVLEVIFRHRESGEEAREAAYTGTTEVAMAITASTLTTLSVFVPVLFVPGIAGQMFNDMVITMCFSLSVSLVVALTLIPLLTSRFLKIEKITRKGKLQTVSDKISQWIKSLEKLYVRSLDWAIHHRWRVVIITFVLFILSIVSLSFLGGEFFPESDQGYVQMTLNRSSGISLDAMEKSVNQLYDIILKTVPEQELVYTNIGQGEGVFAAFSSSASNMGEMMITLCPRNERKRNLNQIQDALMEEFKKIPDLDVSFEDPGAAMFFGGGDIQVKIFGYDLEIAEALAKSLITKIEKIDHVANTDLSVKEVAPELIIQLNRGRIADLGLSTSQVSQTISSCFLGSVATRYRDRGDEYDVRVQLNKKFRSSKSDIENILLMTPEGRHIPLRSIATVEFGIAPTTIEREDQDRKVTIDVDVSGNDLRKPMAALQKVIRETAVPNDFRIEIGGAAEEMQQSFMYLGIAFLVAMILTYMVMASQFESFLDPFIIMFTIPMSIIGVALGLVITGTTLSVMALIGIIMLVGIIVNNGIVLVDYINQLRERGLEMFDAILKAGDARMRPVLMTALTTMFGMLPLALGIGEGSENWAPMARSLIGGLLVGTLLTLIVIPVIYSMFELQLEKRRIKKAGKRS